MRKYYKVKEKNEVALKKYLKNADKKSSNGNSRSSRCKRNNTKRNDIH